MISGNAKLIDRIPTHQFAEVPMKRQERGPRTFALPFALTLLLFTAATFQPSVLAAPPAGETSGQTPGSLGIVGKDGKIQGTCPLKHTDVRAGISGFLARVTVTQSFANTATQNIEAVYLPAAAGSCRR